MIFKQLELTNFKSHQHNIINFNSGITLIIGENGAGKSTIFEAISFALYKKYTGDKIDDLIRTNNTTMSVKLHFVSNGTEYKITRTRTNNQSRAKLEKKDKNLLQYVTIAEGDRTVNEQIQEILEMDADLFLNAIYIRQGEIANLISKSPSERKQLIGKLLKLEELEKAFKNILPFINDYKWKQAELKGQLSNEISIENLKNDIIKYNELTLLYKETEQTKEDLITQQKEIQLEKDKIEELRKEYEEWKVILKNESQNLQRLQKENSDLETEIKNLHEIEQQIQQLKPFVEQLQDYQDEEYLNINEKIKELESEKLSLNTEIQILKNLNEEKQQLKQTIKDDTERFKTIYALVSDVVTDKDFKTTEDLDMLEKQISRMLCSVTTNLEENQQKINNLKEKRSQIKAENDSHKGFILQTEELGSQCPVCKSDIDDDKKRELIQHYDNLIKTNEESITELNYKIDDAEEINNKLTLQMEDLKNIDKKLPQYRWLLENIATNLSSIVNMNERLLDFDSKMERFENIEREINLNKEKIEDRNNKIKSLQKQNQEYNQLLGSIQHKDKTILKQQKLLEEIEIKQQKINNLSNNIKSSQYDEQKYIQIQQTEQKLNSNITSITVSLKEIEIKISELKNNIINLISTSKNYIKNKKEYGYIEQYLILLDDIRTSYSKDGVQKTLRSLSRPIIQNYTRNFFKEFDFNYSNLVLDDEYNIILYGPEGEAKLDMISGGEKIAVALALRLGITEAISKSNIETILLDEPTIHLDSQRIHELITLLTGLSSLPQMIIVTHDIELENAADNLIRVVKENGISNVVGDQT